MKRLPPNLTQKPFTPSEAAKLGINRYALGKLVSEGALEQMARGVYRVRKDDLSEEDQFLAATLRVGTPSAICLISALITYGLTDVIPKKTWIMVPLSKRTAYRDIRLLRTRNPEWKVGIESRDGYQITTIERTIVDCFTYPRKVGIPVAVEGLRRAVQSKKTTLGKVMDVAVKLGVAHRIRPYIEALS